MPAGGSVQAFFCVSMQRTMKWLEQLLVFCSSSRPPRRSDDWPVTDTWSACHFSQCLSTSQCPLPVEPCQMLFWGLMDGSQADGDGERGQEEPVRSRLRGSTHQKGSASTSRPSKE